MITSPYRTHVQTAVVDALTTKYSNALQFRHKTITTISSSRRKLTDMYSACSSSRHSESGAAQSARWSLVAAATMHPSNAELSTSVARLPTQLPAV